MSIRVLLAFLACAWIGQAPAQYGGGEEEMDPPVYTGLWWNPDESGWGLNTTHQGNLIFATLFTYAPDGQPLWLVASGLVGSMSSSYYGVDYRYTGALYHTRGPAFNKVPWSPIEAREVGTMTLMWTSPDVATLTYTFNGSTVTKLVQRQVFASPVPECTRVMGPRAGIANYQDLWWNPDESGWGVNLVHQGNLMFATLFTYDESGRDKWFVASGLARQPDGSFTGALYSTTGPAFDASPWTPFAFQQVGDMSLRFTDGENGTLAYNVGAVGVTKQIRRQVFQAPLTACH
jgi:lysyl endopeptidase